jgi:hypothetical protein
MASCTKACSSFEIIELIMVSMPYIQACPAHGSHCQRLAAAGPHHILRVKQAATTKRASFGSKIANLL